MESGGATPGKVVVPEKEEVLIKMGKETLGNRIIVGTPQHPHFFAINKCIELFFLDSRHTWAWGLSSGGGIAALSQGGGSII